MRSGVHLDLDEAWEASALSIPTLDLRHWGPRLRYSAPRHLVESFYLGIKAGLKDFILYGSGDFHHLSALWLRRFREPLTVVSFDNHPDWDVRPPRWGCGGWINRALELDSVRRVSVWGCGGLEISWPSSLLGNLRALRSGKLEVHGWAERVKRGATGRVCSMTREGWRVQFLDFAESVRREMVYVTIDLDCLDGSEASTNWESGLFSVEDLVWALGELKRRATLAGGDLCGAYSRPRYARWTQRIAASWDHPRLTPIDFSAARRVNLKVFETLWSALG